MACHPSFEKPNNSQFTQWAYLPGGETYKTIPETRITKIAHVNPKLIKARQLNFVFISFKFLI